MRRNFMSVPAFLFVGFLTVLALGQGKPVAPDIQTPSANPTCVSGATGITRHTGQTILSVLPESTKVPQAQNSNSTREAWKDGLQLASSAATVIGVFVAMVTYFVNRSKAKTEREIKAFVRMNDLYRKYLERLIDPQNWGLATVEMQVKRVSKSDLHLLWVMSMLESAFVMYHDGKGVLGKKQWDGWNNYMRDWANHPTAKNHLDKLLKNFDADFVKAMKKMDQSQ